MAVSDWTKIRAHADEVVASTGQWAAILDENGKWLTDVEVETLDFKDQRNAMTSFKATAVVKSVDGGLPHPVVGHLVGEGLGVVGDDGALKPVTDGARFLVVERAGRTRVAGRIGFTKASGDGDTPSVIEISGMNALGELSLLPSPTAPKSWREAKWGTVSRVFGSGTDAGIPLVRARQMAGIILGKNATLHTAKIEEADVAVRTIISEAIESVYTACGLAKAEYPLRVSTRATGKRSPEVLIEPTDASVLATVADVATAAGVTVRAELWLPGDAQPEGLELTLPTFVFHVLQE